MQADFYKISKTRGLAERYSLRNDFFVILFGFLAPYLPKKVLQPNLNQEQQP